LNRIGKQLRSVDDLVGKIWPPEERPPMSQKPIVVHAIQFSGETVTEKLNRTAAELKRLGVTTTIISGALEEIAWLFNLRGDDIPFNPLFKSYAIVHANFTVDQPELFVNLTQLNINDRLAGVRVLDYATFWSRLNATATNTSIGKIWVSPRVSQAILTRIPNEKLLQPLINSPVQRVKARKNAVERAGMRACQTRDAVARMKHLGWLEQQLDDGVTVNETQSVEQLLVYLKQQQFFKSSSFNTISAFGDRAAIIHYAPEAATARNITKNQIYLLDVG
jgi:Xaa-Pro aminopeptidase